MCPGVLVDAAKRKDINMRDGDEGMCVNTT